MGRKSEAPKRHGAASGDLVYLFNNVNMDFILSVSGIMDKGKMIGDSHEF